MKQLISALCLLLLLLACNSGQQPTIDTQAEVANAKVAIKEFAGALQAELKGAMKAGGPVAAIAVCSTKASPIAKKVAAQHGLDLSRVSLKNRNPGNTANPWQSAVLKDFEKKKLAGEDVTQIGWTETADTDDGKEFRFMKAIPTGEICLRCHGAELAPEVSGILAELYPEDRATGYKEGDIRGAFVVTRKF